MSYFFTARLLRAIGLRCLSLCCLRIYLERHLRDVTGLPETSGFHDCVCVAKRQLGMTCNQANRLYRAYKLTSQGAHGYRTIDEFDVRFESAIATTKQLTNGVGV